MKFLTFTVYEVPKAKDIAAVADSNAKIPGQKILAMYTCLGKPFDGVPPNSVVVVGVRETDSTEAMGTALYASALAGANAWAVPVWEMPVGGAVAEEKKYRK